MRCLQAQFHPTLEPLALAPLQALVPQLVLVFGANAALQQPGLVPALCQAFPEAALAGCSTAGEISRAGVSDGSLVVTAIRFEHPGLRVVHTELGDMADSAAAGERLASQLAPPLQGQALHNVWLLGQGVDINGSALIAGLGQALPPQVRLAGGLAGDGGAFTQSFTLSAAGVSSRQLVALGLYAPQLKVRHSSFHGWQPFGPARRVTRSAGNVLYELDGAPALGLYKRYLGEYADGLPGTGLLFPFEMLNAERRGLGLIRTILGVNEADGSLVLAGDIEPDGYLRLMHASTDSLVDGAEQAAQALLADGPLQGERLGLAVSCVGRKLVMGARVDEEVEAVLEVLGRDALMAGFYSNGEISPELQGLQCHLHNQTMTLTLLAEHTDV